MQNRLWTKGLVFGIIILFLGVCVLPSISGRNENNDNEDLSTLTKTNTGAPFVDIYIFADINITFDGDVHSRYVVNIPGGGSYWFIYAHSKNDSYSNVTINWMGGLIEYTPVKNLSIYINNFLGENTLAFGEGSGGKISGKAGFIILIGSTS